jgi:hypothetical protein
MTYGAHLDNYTALKEIGTSPPGFRFNAYLWQVAGEETTLDLYLKGFRVKGGLIHLPSMGAKFASYPTVYLPRVLAVEVAKEVMTNPALRDAFPGAFPLLNLEILTDNLMFQAKDFMRDFPALAQKRGLVTD